MSRTFNRPPQYVPSPSNKVVEKNFFTHINWNGLDKNKNFLAVDQESFADCNNVYVDDVGVLRSRPAIKPHGIKLENTESGFLDRPILKVYRFDDVYIMWTGNSNMTYLDFFEKVDDTLEFKVSMLVGDDNPGNFYLYKVNKDIFIFNNSYLWRYDLDLHTTVNASDRIYVPETVVDVAGIDTKIEKPNVLTTSENIVYLYNPTLGISPEAFDKRMSIELDGVVYNVTYDSHTPYRITQKFSLLQGKFKDTCKVSSRNTFLKFDVDSNKIYYSLDGVTVQKEIELPDPVTYPLVQNPEFSQDGNYIVINTIPEINGARTPTMFIISVVADTPDGSMRFENWTDVATYATVYPPDDYANDSVCNFLTYDKFVMASKEYDTHLNKYAISVQINNGINVITKTFYLETGDYDFKKACFGNLVFDNVIGAGVVTLRGESYSYDMACIVTFNANKNAMISVSNLVDDIKYFNGKITFCGRVASNSCVYYSIDKSYDFINNISYNYIGLTSVNPIKLYNTCDKIFVNKGTYFIKDNVYEEFINETDNVHIIDVSDYAYYLSYTTQISPHDTYNFKTNRITEVLKFKYQRFGEIKFIVPKYISELDNHYIGIDKTLYITSYREKDGNFLWYLPENDVHYFDGYISGLHPISDEVMCVFCNDDTVWYIAKNEGNYYIVKSKVELSVPVGGDILTSYDGQMTMYCSKRGFVALAYQNFVSSTEQAITFLSDKIYDEVKEFIKSPVKLYKQDFWIVLYNNTGCYIFDVRNNSWWPIEQHALINDIFEFNHKTYFVQKGKIYFVDTAYENYHDIINGKREQIPWSIVSQKLHFGNLNMYKHIYNITLTNTIPDKNDDLYHTLEAVPSHSRLTITNYRKFKDINKEETLYYDIESIRTFVQRLNYMKVNEFQYRLSTDTESTFQIPLSLTSVCVKYKFMGGVR